MYATSVDWSVFLSRMYGTTKSEYGLLHLSEHNNPSLQILFVYFLFYFSYSFCNLLGLNWPFKESFTTSAIDLPQADLLLDWTFAEITLSYSAVASLILIKKHTPCSLYVTIQVPRALTWTWWGVLSLHALHRAKWLNSWTSELPNYNLRSVLSR